MSLKEEYVVGSNAELRLADYTDIVHTHSEGIPTLGDFPITRRRCLAEQTYTSFE